MLSRVGNQIHPPVNTVRTARLWTDAGCRAVESIQLYQFNEVSDGALGISLHPNPPSSTQREKHPLPALLTGQGGAEASQHMVHHRHLQLYSHCSGCPKTTSTFSRRWRRKWLFFFPFRKERQHFLSQNNLSLSLTRLPAIFTQLKLQMICFQLHSAAHAPVNQSRGGPPEQ